MVDRHSNVQVPRHDIPIPWAADDGQRGTRDVYAVQVERFVAVLIQAEVTVQHRYGVVVGDCQPEFLKLMRTRRTVPLLAVMVNPLTGVVSSRPSIAARAISPV